ncbi:MAG: hypothetical protein CBB84_006750 [Phycisphaera sp. TMED24]|nr:MAG: hypothetical protein CBB84_006750 [Phycisphaera sp. TMED24]
MNNASSLAKIFAVVGLTVMVWILAHQSTRTEVLGTVTLRLVLGDGQELDPNQMTGAQWRVANNERNEQVIEIKVRGLAAPAGSRWLNGGPTVDLPLMEPTSSEPQDVDLESALENNPEFSQRGVTVLSVEPQTARVRFVEVVQVNDVRIQPVGTDGRALADVTTEPEQVDVWLPSSLLESLGGVSALVVEAEIGARVRQELARSGTSTARLRGLRNAGELPPLPRFTLEEVEVQGNPTSSQWYTVPKPVQLHVAGSPEASLGYELTPPAISGVMVELNQEVRKELEALDNVVVLGIIHLRRDERVPGTNIQHRIDQFVIRRADGSVEPVRWKLQDAPSELVQIRVLGSE